MIKKNNDDDNNNDDNNKKPTYTSLQQSPQMYK